MQFAVAKTDEDLRQILELQKKNLPRNISTEESKIEGFVTVDHSFEILKKMNHPYPHSVAIDSNKVIAYALVMLQSVRDDINILKPMFDKIDEIQYNQKALSKQSYFVMGQVCIDKAYRSQGLFYKLYDHLKASMQSGFDMVITEVSKENPRSLKAHYNQGFINILSYQSPDGHSWEILLWDFG